MRAAVRNAGVSLLGNWATVLARAVVESDRPADLCDCHGARECPNVAAVWASLDTPQPTKPDDGHAVDCDGLCEQPSHTPCHASTWRCPHGIHYGDCEHAHPAADQPTPEGAALMARLGAMSDAEYRKAVAEAEREIYDEINAPTSAGKED